MRKDKAAGRTVELQIWHPSVEVSQSERRRGPRKVNDSSPSRVCKTYIYHIRGRRPRGDQLAAKRSAAVLLPLNLVQAFAVRTELSFCVIEK